ncbi:MAG: DUF4363 family protein [Clostridia bacterium]|nr:DUF4363 family protein [Clostridia bacterium]
MKTIILPICLLVLVIAFMAINGAFVSNSLKAVIKETESLPDTPDDSTLAGLNEIEQKWNKYKEYYSAVSKYDTIYNISKDFESAKAGCIADDPGTYLSARKSLVIAFEYIKDLHSFRWDNII